jgi:hypothetical protein
MQELLRAMDLDGPAPGSANAEHSQDMRFNFHLTVSSQCSCSCWYGSLYCTVSGAAYKPVLRS